MLSIPFGSGWPMGTLLGDRRAFVIKVSVNNVSVSNQSVEKALAGNVSVKKMLVSRVSAGKV